MNPKQAPSKLRAFMEQWCGLLLPLVTVGCVTVPVLLKHWMPALGTGAIALIGVGGFALLLVLLILDWNFLQRRAKEPGFNAWDEI